MDGSLCLNTCQFTRPYLWQGLKTHYSRCWPLQTWHIETLLKKKKATSCLKIAGHCGFSERDSNRKYTTFCQGFSGSETNTDPNIEIQTEVWESVLTRVFVAVYLWPTMQSGTQQSVGMKSELALSWHLCKLGWMSARKNECHVQTGLTRFVFCQCAFDMQDIYTYVWPS